jgi:hypothetical protein
MDTFSSLTFARGLLALVCVALQRQQAMKRYKVFVSRSHRYGDPSSEVC